MQFDKRICDHFRSMFGTEIEAGREEMIALVKRSLHLGKAVEDAFRANAYDSPNFVSQSNNRISDRDLLLLSFFALLGAGAQEALGLPKQIEAGSDPSTR